MIIVLTGLLLIVSLALLTLNLTLKEKQLKRVQASQARLGGMLINAEERERSRVASELHDDFSQRLAVIALKLENVAEIVSASSKEADRQLHEIFDSVSELGRICIPSLTSCILRRWRVLDWLPPSMHSVRISAPNKGLQSTLRQMMFRVRSNNRPLYAFSGSFKKDFGISKNTVAHTKPW